MGHVISMKRYVAGDTIVAMLQNDRSWEADWNLP